MWLAVFFLFVHVQYVGIQYLNDFISMTKPPTIRVLYHKYEVMQHICCELPRKHIQISETENVCNPFSS